MNRLLVLIIAGLILGACEKKRQLLQGGALVAEDKTMITRGAQPIPQNTKIAPAIVYYSGDPRPYLSGSLFASQAEVDQLIADGGIAAVAYWPALVDKNGYYTAPQ